MLDKTISSKELNDILINSTKRIKEVEDKIGYIKQDLEGKVKVLKAEKDYSLDQLSYVTSLIESSEEHNKLSGLNNKIMFYDKDKIEGIYDSYGISIHEKLLRAPFNIFNLLTTRGYIYRDSVQVNINEQEDFDFKEVLRHDSIDNKQVFFKAYEEEELILKMKIKDYGTLGKTRFNVIEIDPYLAGSFNIEEVKIFTEEPTEEGDNFIEVKHHIDKVGKTRIILENKYDFYEAHFKIKLHYNQNGQYLFGLRHMYFLECDFNKESYIVAKFEKNNFIEFVSESIYIKDIYQKNITNLKDSNIPIYMFYQNGVLEYRLNSYTPEEPKVLTRNTKEFYARIPLINKPLVSLEFDNIPTR